MAKLLVAITVVSVASSAYADEPATTEPVVSSTDGNTTLGVVGSF
jgi:hypothetical protein